MPELLADLPVLGSWPDRIVELLRRRTPLGDGARALELGCGTGAVAVRLARELGFEVLGIDLFPPFLERARQRAAAAGVDERCRFERDDLRRAVERLGGHDVVVLAAVGTGVLGGITACVGALRRTVRRGGYVVIDDGFLARPAASARPGYEHSFPLEETRRRLTAHGDRLVGESLVPRAELAAVNRANLAAIRERAAALTRARPQLAAAVSDYLRHEEEECRFLETETTDAVWLLERR